MLNETESEREREGHTNKQDTAEEKNVNNVDFCELELQLFSSHLTRCD